MYQAGVPADEAQNRYAVPDNFKNFPIYAWGFTSARPSQSSTSNGKLNSFSKGADARTVFEDQ